MKRALLSLLFLPTLALAKLPSEDDTPYPPREPGPHSVNYHEEILIDAEPRAIWDAIVDLSAYSEWNPWIVEAEGDTKIGGIVFVDVVLGQNTMKAKHVVITVEPEKRFCWRDAGWNANFLYGQRCRTLTVQPDGRVLYQVDLLLDGILSKVSDVFNGKDLEKGMKAETQALKARAESAE